tara:strand:- start:173 stop:373 length:201 start_codon:yes stop_codon:yes gene_type:complete
MNNTTEIELYHNDDGELVAWVFPSPGKIWKSRWVAFTNREEFVWFKGEKDAARAWASKYCGGDIDE